MREPGPLIASGRDADIFDYGPGLVIRRARDGRSIAAEARVMDLVHATGYPVPAIDEVSEDGRSIVMERIDGVPMVDVLGSRPWTVRRNADVLADLHLRLHELHAPEWMPPAPCAPGDRIVHLDLHPLNVLITARGPVVIDWANARRGHPATDVVLTWVLNVAGHVDTGPVIRPVVGYVRRLYSNRFLSHFEMDDLVEHLPAVVEWKLQDAHMSREEQDAMRNLVATHA